MHFHINHWLFRLSFRVTAKERERMRGPAFRIPREDFFSISLPSWGKEFFWGDFPSHMRKNHEKMNFYLLKWAKSVIFVGREEILFSLPTAGNDSKKFLFPHGRREIFLGDFSSRMWEGKRLSSHFPSQRPPCFLYQWKVHSSNRHKLTVIFYRNQKLVNVVVMNYRDSSAYVQRQIDKILRNHQHFVKAYVNNIVIFSKTIQEHKMHLQKIFDVLSLNNKFINSTKIFFDFSSINLLKQHVTSLKLFTD